MKVTVEMGDAWVAYETAERIPNEWNLSTASRMLKHAFLSGYIAASAGETRRAETTGSVEDEHAVPKGDAQ